MNLLCRWTSRFVQSVAPGRLSGRLWNCTARPLLLSGATARLQVPDRTEPFFVRNPVIRVWPIQRGGAIGAVIGGASYARG